MKETFIVINPLDDDPEQKVCTEDLQPGNDQRSPLVFVNTKSIFDFDGAPCVLSYFPVGNRQVH